MIREIPLGSSDQVVTKQKPNLPAFKPGLQSFFSKGESFQVDGTNVVRVPFGIRRSKKQRPERPERWATLVLPLQPAGSPPPPPQAA